MDVKEPSAKYVAQGRLQRTELGVLPVDWAVKKAGEIGEALIGLTYRPAEVRDDGVLVLRSSNIQNGALAFDDNVFVATDIPERIRVREGDILICVRNGSRDLIGKTALLDGRVVGMTFGAFMAVFRTPSFLFVHHQMRSTGFKRQVRSHLGATINQITNASLKSFLIPLPPTSEEQQSIGVALQDADDLIESLEQLIAKKRLIKQGAMQELLTGKKRLPGFGQGQRSDELPLGWVQIPAREIGVLRGGSGFPLTLQGGASGEYPFFKVSDLDSAESGFLIRAKNYVGEATRRQLGATAFPRSTIVFAKVGAAVFLERKVLLAQASCIDNNLAGFTITSPDVDPYFVHRLLQLICLSDLVSTTALPSLNGQVLGSMSLRLPRMRAEQEAIRDVLSDLDTELTALETKLAKARALKHAMSEALLTGRIRLWPPVAAAA